MNWHIELAIEIALFLVLIYRAPRLPWFEALIGVDVAEQVLQLAGQRFHYLALGARVWRIGVLLEIPLIFMALIETLRIQHVRRNRAITSLHPIILYAWLALVMGCAWVRIYPYTGWALLVVNACAYAAWCALFLLEAPDAR